MRDGWEIKKLGDVTSIKSGKSIDAGLISSDTSLYPCYGGNGVRGFVGSYSHNGCFLIIGRVGALCGNIHLAEGKFYATEHALVVEIKDTNIYSEWLKYNLISLNLRSIAKGVAQPVISAGEVSNITVPVPPLAEQERIVEELDLLSGIIEKQKQQLKEYDTLAQSIFYDMFGNPITNEKGLSIQQLGDFATSVTYGTSFPANEGGKLIYLRMNNLTYDGYLDLNDVKTIDVPDKDLDKYVVRKGDILFNRTNSRDLVGKTALFDLDNEMVIAGYIIRVRVDEEKMLPVYVVRYMNTPFMKSYYYNLCKGAVNQANINSKELKAMPLPVPPLSLQQEFAEKIEAIEKQKAILKQSIEETETLFNSRMDYYFN